MDKYEYKVRHDQIKKLYQEERYKEAAKVADTIDWRKVKDWSTLAMVINIYETTDHIEDAKNVCILAYNRKLGGRRLIYKLCELLIKTGDLDEAEEVYEEFVAIAPKDLSRFSLRYQLYTAKGASADKLISILNEYNELDRDEFCLNELANLYEKSGQIEKCMQTCDDIILWFNGGDYYESALKLKRKYGALTHNQKLMLEHAESLKENPYAAKKRTVTIELPKGVLTAGDIIKAATGEIDTKEVNEAAKEYVREAGKKESDKASYKVDVNVPHEDIKETAKPEKEDRVKLPDMTITRKERPTPELKPHKPPKGFLGLLSKSDKKEAEDIAEEVADTESSVEPESDKTSKTDSNQIFGSIDEALKSLDNEKDEEKVEADTDTDALQSGESESDTTDESQASSDDTPKFTETQALRIEAEVLKEESRAIAQEHVESGDFADAKNNTVKIPIPDYTYYDTVNIQKEIAENIKPYIEAMEKEEKGSMAVVSEGDIITTDDGVFRVTEDTNRMVVPGINYKLEAVSEDELFGNVKENMPSYEEESSETVADETLGADIETADETVAEEIENDLSIENDETAATEEKETEDDLSKTVRIEIPPKYASRELTEDVLTAETINLGKVIDEIKDSEQEQEISLVDVAKEVAATVQEDEYNDMESRQTLAYNREEIERELSSYSAEEDTKETMADDKQAIESSYTQEINAKIVESLGIVEKREAEELSPIFESTLMDDDEENVDYDSLFEEVFEESFGKYANLKGMKKQVYDCIEKLKNSEKDSSSRKGNLVIAGNKSVKKTDVAIAFVRTLNMVFPDKKRKIAKTNAENLNKRGVMPVMTKLRGSALVIENASGLSEELVVELTKVMNEDTDEMLVILTDNESSILRFLGNHNKFGSYFDNLIEIRKYNVNELVDMAKEYASGKNCIINDKALLKLYLVIDKKNTGEDSADIHMVHSIIDDAIENAKVRISKGFFGKLRKNSDTSPISIKEADFDNITE